MKRRHFLAMVWGGSTLLRGCGGGATVSPSSGGTAEVPLQVDGWHIKLNAVIDGLPARLLLDSGATANILAPAFAARLQAKLSDKCYSASGPSGVAECAHFVPVRRMEVGPAWMADSAAVVMQLAPELQVDGILGLTFLRQFVVRIDYHAQRLQLWTPSQAPVPSPNARRLDMEDINTLLVRLRVGGVEGRFAVDTGAGNVITFFYPTVERLGLRERFAPAVRMVTGLTVNGLSTEDLVRVDKIEIGGFELQRPVVALWPQAGPGWGSQSLWEGNLGAELLHRFTVTLDAPGRAMYLEPSPRLNDPFSAPAAGVVMRWVEHRLRVLDVVPGSPAGEAGLNAGEHVLAIDGAPVREEDGRNAWNPLRGPVGRVVTMDVGDDPSTSKRVTLVLRELV